MKYAEYEKYIESSLEWTGEIPSHWQIKKIGHLALLKSGENIVSEEIAEGGEYPVFGGNGFRGYFNQYTHEGSFVLIGRQGALCGNVNYARGKFWASEHALVAYALTEFDTHWFGETLRAMNLNQYSVSAAQPGLSASAISALRLPFPPLDEQQTIARFLDAKTAQIDELIAKKRQLIDKLREKRQALIARTVTRGLPPEAAKAAGLESNPEMKNSRVGWLGEIPVHWTEDKVVRLFRAMKGRNAAQLTKEYCATIEGEYPVYSGQTENDGVMSSIDEFEFDAGGDGYLFSTTVGAKAMSLMHLKGKFSLSQNCMVIAPISAKVSVRFYYYHLQPLFQFERGLIPEHMQASFRMEDLYQYRIGIPPIREQVAISEYLDQTCSKIDCLIAFTDQAISQLNEFRQALITSAVTGKIDVRGLV